MLHWPGIIITAKENIKELNLEEEIELITRKVRLEWQRRWDEDIYDRMTYEFINKIIFSQNKWFNPNRSCTYLITEYGQQ